MIAVSIHAPVKGATPAPQPRAARRARFNPRAREGRDDLEPANLPRCASFNPRAREGRDDPPFRASIVISQFQSTRP